MGQRLVDLQKFLCMYFNPIDEEEEEDVTDDEQCDETGQSGTGSVAEKQATQYEKMNLQERLVYLEKRMSMLKASATALDEHADRTNMECEQWYVARFGGSNTN